MKTKVTLEIEPAVAAMALAMQYKLDKNQHKRCESLNPSGTGRNWDHCSLSWLLDRCKDEIKELEESLIDGDNQNVIYECADVANFAMMIQDRIYSSVAPRENPEG